MIKLRPLKQLSQAGFTLVELLVVVPILMVTIVIMMGFLFDQYGQLTQEGAELQLKTEAQLVTLALQDDVFFANAFTQTINDGLNDPHSPSGGWRYNTNPQTLIISTPALTKHQRDPEREPVYINTLGCGAAVLEQNDILYNNIIYFASGTNLYKRVVSAPSSMSTCGTSFITQTCPQNQSSEACPQDTILTDQLADFDVVYYDQDNDTVSDPEQATRVKVTVRLEGEAFAGEISATDSISLKRLNQ